MEILGIAFVSLTFICLALAMYFYVSRDLERYHRRVEERLQKLIDERGTAVVSQRDIQQLKQELLSEIPPVHRLLLRFEVFNRLQTILRQAEFNNVTVYKFVVSSLIAGFVVASFAAAYQRSIFVWLVSLIVVSSLPLMFVLQRRRRRFKLFIEQLPEALEMIVRSLQAGHSFSSALQAIATEMPDPVAREFGKAYEEQNLGLSMQVALENLAERVPIMDLKLCVTAILIQREVGGNLSEVLANISHTIRERFRIQGEIRVKTAQARLSGYIVSALPFILFFWINAANPKYLQSLYDHPMGMYILGAGVVMQIIGWLIIRRIVRIEI
ncbi:MAG TPA: type II secretion system F family protein [Blastocatellia bacterium]|nr:type II secretion system F family protein [Blastocatellia bacterium]